MKKALQLPWAKPEYLSGEKTSSLTILRRLGDLFDEAKKLRGVVDYRLVEIKK